MIQLNPDNMIRIELTPKEQKMLLRYCQSIDSDIYDRIANCPDRVLHLMIEDCCHLRECIRTELDRAKKPKVQDVLAGLWNKLSPSPVTREIAEELSNRDFESLEDANLFLQNMMSKRNSAPAPEMGGLSPEQVHWLLYSDWESPDCPIKFNRNLTINDVKDASIFHNTRLLLNALIDLKDSPTATAKGKFSRKVITEIFGKMYLDERSVINTMFKKVINEDDIFPLHILRIVCEETGLILPQKKKFIVTEQAKSLLADEKAGELFFLLFNGYYRRFNIAYVDAMPDLTCIQDTIGYTLYQLSKLTKPSTMDELAEMVFLPTVRNEIKGALAGNFKEQWIVASRITHPLCKFGLLKYDGDSEKHTRTKLYNKFMVFELKG